MFVAVRGAAGLEDDIDGDGDDAVAGLLGSLLVGSGDNRGDIDDRVASFDCDLLLLRLDMTVLLRVAFAVGGVAGEGAREAGPPCLLRKEVGVCMESTVAIVSVYLSL
jgi:hypothetical protein